MRACGLVVPNFPLAELLRRTTLMTDESPDPNPEGAGYTQINLPTEMVIDMGRRLRINADLSEAQKDELLSAIMRAIG